MFNLIVGIQAGFDIQPERYGIYLAMLTQRLNRFENRAGAKMNI